MYMSYGSPSKDLFNVIKLMPSIFRDDFYLLNQEQKIARLWMFNHGLLNGQKDYSSFSRYFEKEISSNHWPGGGGVWGAIWYCLSFGDIVGLPLS